jgi:hypothetical protein
VANVPWLNISPSLQLQAIQAGTGAGQNRAQMAQQAAIESARMEAAANELNTRLRGDAARLAMETAARTQMANTEAELARDTLRQRSAESALDRALRGREIGVRETQIQNEAMPMELRQFRDPATGEIIGSALGKSVMWNRPQRELQLEVVVDPSTGQRIGLEDANGRFYRDPPKSLLQQAAERVTGGFQTNAPISALSSLQSTNAAPKRFRWDNGKLVPQ